MDMIHEGAHLARQQVAQAAIRTAPRGEYLTFRLGAEEYGIDILTVQEIRSYEPPTRIAGAPPFIKGMVNLRGVIVPIIDLRLKFDLQDARYDSFTVVIVLNLMDRVIGVVVDSVSDVVALETDQVKAPPRFSHAVNAGYITGIGCVTQPGDAAPFERMMILMDIEGLMSAADMGLIGQAVQ